MSISLNPAHRYKVPDWDKFLFTGPLTDSRIGTLVRAGHYGPEAKRRAQLVDELIETIVKKRKAKRPKLTVEQLMKRYRI